MLDDLVLRRGRGTVEPVPLVGLDVRTWASADSKRSRLPRAAGSSRWFSDMTAESFSATAVAMLRTLRSAAR